MWHKPKESPDEDNPPGTKMIARDQTVHYAVPEGQVMTPSKAVAGQDQLPTKAPVPYADRKAKPPNILAKVAVLYMKGPKNT